MRGATFLKIPATNANSNSDGKKEVVTGGTKGHGAAIGNRLAAGRATAQTPARSLPAHGFSDHMIAADSGSGIRLVDQRHTTIVVQRHLSQLARLDGSAPADPIIRALIDSAVSRLHL